MLGREAVADGERAHGPCPPRFGNHPTVACDRARAISSAVKVHQYSGRVPAGSDRPFARHAIEIGGLKLDVAGDRPDRADFVKAVTASLPAYGSGLRAEKRADGVDFALGHGQSLFLLLHSPRRGTTCKADVSDRESKLAAPVHRRTQCSPSRSARIGRSWRKITPATRSLPASVKCTISR